ncbi:MAG: hypothetical protein DRH50_02360 [Deltaproteobacteria bacterium]|nr:MAG: hypothetical protein DRH50_02360 [Deltaproteobacteria bacterium]
MSNRQFDTRTETKSSLSQQPVRRREQGHVAETSIFPKRDPLPRAISSAGNLLSASTHAAMLKYATAGRPPRAEQSLLQLQRQYGNRYVQRVLALAGKGTGGAEAAPDVEQAIQRVRGGGQALDSGACTQMESAFGADFSGVRVHTDGEADTLNRQLSARAFTTGQDIFFKQGAYNPGSSSGRELLAHELTHVVQQNGDKVQRKLTVGQPGDKYEQEADQVAQAVMQQEQQPVQRESDEGLVRRQVEEEEEEVQMKSEYSLVQRQVEAEGKKPIQGKCEDGLVQMVIDPISAAGLGIAVFGLVASLVPYGSGGLQWRRNIGKAVHKWPAGREPAQRHWVRDHTESLIDFDCISGLSSAWGFWNLRWNYNGADIDQAHVYKYGSSSWSGGHTGSAVNITFEMQDASASYESGGKAAMICYISGSLDPSGAGDIDYDARVLIYADGTTRKLGGFNITRGDASDFTITSYGAGWKVKKD